MYVLYQLSLIGQGILVNLSGNSCKFVGGILVNLSGNSCKFVGGILVNF